MPVNALIRIPNRWAPPPCKILAPSSWVICKSESDTNVMYDSAEMKLPFVLAEIIHAPTRSANSVIVKWFVPPTGPMVRPGGGKKKPVVDLFGVWTPADEMELGIATRVTLPSPLVPTENILEFNFNLDDGHIPFEVLDRLRTNHGIDVTAVSMSQTGLGGRYRAHVLMTPGS